MVKLCKHCGSEFDVNSRAKRLSGGLINECPDCVEELDTDKGPTLIGVMSGDGKVGMVTVMKFEDAGVGKQFLHNWRLSTGHFRGKSCQMGNTRTLDMDGKGVKVGEFGGNPNHKGNRSEY
jgi:hypothetical protein